MKHFSNYIKYIYTIVAIIVLYFLLQNKIDLDQLGILNVFSCNNLFNLIFFVSLIMINWWLEAYKWYTIVRNVKYQSILMCLKLTLYALFLQLFIPLGIGDFWIKKNKLAHQNLHLILYHQFSANIVLIFLFCIAQIFWLPTLIPTISLGTIFIFLTVILLAMLFVFRWFLQKYNNNNKLKFDIQLLKVMGLTILRYTVLILQYVIVFKIFSIEISNLYLVSGMVIVFFFKTFVPTFLDIGIREITIIGLFGSIMYINTTLLFSLSLFVWIFNVIIPALVGVCWWFIFSEMKFVQK